MAITRLAEIDDDLPPGPLAAEAEARPPTRRLLWLELALAVAATWLAAAALGPVFPTFRTFAAPTLSAALVATAGAVLAARRGLPLRWSIVASAAVALVFVSYTVLVGSLAGGVVPGADTVSGLRRGTGHGFSLMLDSTLPLRDHTLALVFVTLVTWAATVLTVEITQRTTIPSLPLLAPLAVLALAMPVVAPGHAPNPWHVGLLVVLCLVVVLVRAVPDPKATGTVIGPRVDGLAEFHSRSLLSSRLALGLPLILLCAVLAPVVGEAITTRDPADPRDLRADVVEPVRVDDPLGEYKRIVTQSPARPAFQVTVVGATAAEVERVAVVRLDAYDGVRFTTTDRYTEVGSVLTPVVGRPATGRDITLRFANLDLEDPWLPTGGTPLDTDLRGVGFDSRSGDLLAPGSVKGLSYEVRARLVTPTAADLAASGVDMSAGADAYRTLPGGLPPGLGRVAAEITAGAVSPADALDKIQAYLRTGFTVDQAGAAGHSAGRLEQFLRTDRRGSAEQFAAAFAVMARSLGFPARVVVGYKVVATDNGATRPLEFVTSASYHVWAEVLYDQLGWVAYDPTPTSATTAATRTTDAAGAPDTVTPSTGGEQRTPREVGPSEADPADETSAAWWRPILYVIGVVASVLGLVAAGCGAIIGIKAMRRRRRRTQARPADRIAGAWDEVVDRLLELRFPITPSMTPRDITAATRAVYGTAATLPLSFLVPDVGRAVFSRHAPDDEVADRSWLRAIEFEQNLAITLTRRQRWQARLSLRPMRPPKDDPDTVAIVVAPR